MAALAAVGGALLLAWFAVLNVHPFLAVNRPVSARVLVVEAWLPNHALWAAAEEAKRGGYDWVLAAGGPLASSGVLTEYVSGAEAAAVGLRRLGVPAEKLVEVSSPYRDRDRTFASARAVKAWLDQRGFATNAINVFTLGVHARRSWLMYRRALGDPERVGVICQEDPYYQPKRWWASSEGVRAVSSEALAYAYAKLVFPWVAESARE